MRRTKEEAAQTRGTILAAAARLFAERGVSTTSLEMIARAAGVTRGAVYWHFRNKTEIFDALHADLFEPITAMLHQGLEPGSESPLEQLRHTCVQVLDDILAREQKQQSLRLFMLRPPEANLPSETETKHLQRKTESIALFTRYFERAQASGHICPEASPELLSLSIRCYLRGLIAEYLRYPQLCPLVGNTDTLMQVFFDGLKQKCRVNLR